MAIHSVLINTTDASRSVDFYSRFLGVEPIEVTETGAVLDAVTATLRLALVDSPDASTWVSDDLQAGFRHVGFKVADLDDRVARLHEAGVPFQLEPIHAEGDVRITFFYDPDGTLLELVEGPLQYHEVYDRDAVDQDWGLGEPSRPRFDHIAETVADVRATQEHFGQLGYRLMAGIHQPNDPRGFEINFLRDGDTSLEIFTYDRADKESRVPQLSAPGFVAAEFDGVMPASATAVGSAFGVELFADPDGLVHAAVAS
ncbi:MAG TPA: VOC family protein [Lacisediminihabitans sp.]|uniref:VOC family protein n=1 Tax=Lacisediminihabitans sp. TaxID=2787631 RepID=UPI002ED932C2